MIKRFGKPIGIGFVLIVLIVCIHTNPFSRKANPVDVNDVTNATRYSDAGGTNMKTRKLEGMALKYIIDQLNNAAVKDGSLDTDSNNKIEIILDDGIKIGIYSTDKPHIVTVVREKGDSHEQFLASSIPLAISLVLP